jgi:hypothetical protein
MGGKKGTNVRFEISTVMKIQVMVFGLGHHVMMWHDTIMSEDQTASIFRQHDTQKLWYPTTSLYGITPRRPQTEKIIKTCAKKKNIKAITHCCHYS